VKTRIERLKTLEEQEQNGVFEILPKKEAAIIKKELKKLKNHLDGIKNMPRIPDILVIIDQRRELTAIKEAISLNIPIISLLDSNCDPDLVNLPIPGNDDSIGSVKLILKTLGKSILNGMTS
jgi:small subunit ribosomal protein S2